MLNEGLMPLQTEFLTAGTKYGSICALFTTCDMDIHDQEVV